MGVFRPFIAILLAVPVLGNLAGNHGWDGYSKSLNILTQQGSSRSVRRQEAPTCAPAGSSAFTPLERLNNPFQFVDGRPVEGEDDWTCRRQEILTLFQRLELGTLPPAPTSLTASLSGSSLTINVSSSNATTSFVATIEYPAGDGPFPAIIGIGGSESVPTPRAIAMITFNNREIATDSGPEGRGQGKFYDLYGVGHPAGALTAWSWGVSRIIDALSNTSNSRIDVNHIAVAGCSNNGKGALVAGALDERIALTIPVESGVGGAACWRPSQDLRDGGVDIISAFDLANTTTLFSTAFNSYATRVNTLPFDHHLLAALIAPRGLLILDNSRFSWLGPSSVFGCMKSSRDVFRALRVGSNLGISVVGDHDHCAFPDHQYPEYNAFVNKFLRGNARENTNVVKSDLPNNGGFDDAKYVDWNTPLLIELPPPPPPPARGQCDAPVDIPASINPRLIGPFEFVDSSKEVTNANDWYCRRQEIGSLFQRLELGHFPPQPDVSSSVHLNTLTIKLSYEGRSVSFQANITYPEGKGPWDGPFAAFIVVGTQASIPAPPQLVMITFDPQQIAVDNGASSRATGVFYDLYGINQSGGAILAWSWAVSRVIDAVLMTPNNGIDGTKFGVTGCSNSGKAALVAGAFDERISLTVPVETGTGGTGCFRIADEIARNGSSSVTARNLSSTTPLFSTAFAPYAQDVRTLPIDHHLLSAMVAPRGLLVLDNSQFPALGPSSVWGCASSAAKIFGALGVKDHIGISIVGGHDHCQFPSQQYPELYAFVNKFLRGNVSEPTNYMKTDVPNNGGFEEVRWVDWIVPDLGPGTNPPPAPGTCQAPSNLSLTSNPRLNNPFSFAGGSGQVGTSGDWLCRRNELADLFQRYEIGPIPPRPSSVSGSFSGSTLTINISENGRNISFTANVSYPAGATGPVPGIIAINGLTLPAPAGVATLVFNSDQIAGSTRGKGLFYQVYPNHAAGSLGATAWAVSRIIDALSSTSSVNVDASRLAVTGCMDDGKAALVAGAFDQRIVLTIPVESGTGGAGCWRVAEDLSKSGVGVVTASNLVSTTLFSANFSQYANQVSRLPFDHHLLAALVAPRGLLILDNSHFSWLGPSSVYGCMTAAGKVYRSLGFADRLGISIVGSKDLCVFNGQQYPEFNAFINKFLRGLSQENTAVSKIDLPNNGGYDESEYVDWGVPIL
ncbi:hypothetical protein BKA70DRAFT_717400 [Coprinopsis sp. MPI-PUGE-AT-0042]|nr:hypothetical protein BKA70DRAFT_717400 [Coprinopsis sp. MPI-PUGE-AT-0042]